MTVGIYGLRFTNGKMYVGLSNNIENRIRAHRWNANRGNYPTVPLYNAMRTHDYIWGVIEECERTELTDRECYWIERLDTLIDNNCGYNVRQGGAINTGYTGIRKKRPKLSQLHKDRISQSCQGRVQSMDTRDSISNTLSNGAHHSITDWQLTYKNGQTVVVTNLSKWCRDNDYNCSVLTRMNRRRRGTHKNIAMCIKLSWFGVYSTNVYLY